MARILVGFVFAMMACGGEVTAQPAVDAGAETTAEVAVPDTLPKCCALGTPACGCTVVGTKEDGSCLSLCDAKPIGWTKSVDAKGCPQWDVPAGSCLGEPPACPGSASVCPPGCGAVSAAQYNTTRSCVNVGGVTVGCIPAAGTCTGMITCKVRISDGAAFRFGMGCALDGFRECTPEESSKVLGAPYCEGIDAGGFPG